MEGLMAEDDETVAVSRFGWFSAGALAVIVPLALFLLGRDLLQYAQMEENTPAVIIEAP